MRTIKELSDGTIIAQGKGSFDDYCVFVTRKGQRTAPRDVEYFTFFQQKSQVYGAERIYNDFVEIYNMTTGVVNSTILEKINVISQTYGSDALEFNMWYTAIYLGMVAEELKARAVLKKRIKRLGMYQLLMENRNVYEAANFSRGKSARELGVLCTEYGF